MDYHKVYAWGGFTINACGNGEGLVYSSSLFFKHGFTHKPSHIKFPMDDALYDTLDHIILYTVGGT